MDGTVKIAEKFNVDKILHNQLKTGEAGKAIGAQAAKNDITAFIDSDNILPSRDWLQVMVKPFSNVEITGTEPLYYTYRKEDSLITRYCALMGMNDILCLFLGNYDRYNYLTERWTELKMNVVDQGNQLLLKLDKFNVPTIGANGFMVRTQDLKDVDYTPYCVDIDVVYQLVKSGRNKYVKVKTGIAHLFADDKTAFVRKTCRRIGDYLYHEKFGSRKYPWRSLNRLGLLKFVLYTLLIIPLIKDSLTGYKKIPDKAWRFHPLACWLTLMVYSIKFITKSN